ncbi:MAG: 30S ribosomal protein S3 [Candidatus Yanofskybacteria bacterium]|nr:30S ribosomal protein S3 [Candidatus Yanofskybacteria bacterium]
MGQKISPTSFRIGLNKDWLSRWFGLGRKYVEYFREDFVIRQFLSKKIKNMSVDRVEIEKSPDVLTIIIHTARPGLLIGRGGTGAEDLKKEILRLVKRKTAIRIDIQEYKNPETSAAIMAESIVEQIEKRMPFRRILKQTLAKIIANKKDVKGAKIEVAGRLNGAEIARTEHLEEGNLPLQTLRAEIDYAKRTAHTTYGTIGVKVWIYKGERFGY